MMSLLLDHLWQSTLFALAVGLFTLMLGRNSANVRHWLWFAASLKFLLPFSLIIMVGAWIAPHLAPKASIPSAYASATYAISDAVRPFSAKAPVLAAPTVNTPDFGTALLAIWLLGFVCLIGFWLFRWLQLRSAVNAAEPLHLGTPVPVFSSNRKLEPGLIGIFKPIVLLPEGITGRLSPEEMHATLAHELSHLERKDNLTATIHMLVEALFWFYPLVWWIGARLINEREKACDEAVVEAGSDPQTYAEGILKVCQFYLHSPLACAAGVSGADLKRRMEAIMENQASLRLNFTKKVLLAATFGLLLSAPLALGFIGAAPVAQTLPTQEEHARMLMEQAMPRTAIAYNPGDFDKYAGYYQVSNVIAFFKVHRDGTHLFIRLTGPQDKELYPESPTKFFTKVVDAQVSFDSDSQGRVTGLVLHRDGWEYPAKKVDEGVAKSAEAAEAVRFRNQTPDPAREAPLRRFIITAVAGTPAFDVMSPALADTVRKGQPIADKMFKKTGAFKSLTFKGVGPGGNDIYIAAFEHANQEWRIGPLTPDGKIYWIVSTSEPPSKNAK